MSHFSLTRLEANARTARAVHDLARRAEATDGDPPFSDQTLVEIRTAASRVTVMGALQISAAPEDPPRGELTDERPESLMGAAVVVASADAQAPTLMEAVVAPEHRGHGLGRSLIAAALGTTDGPVDAWAHGDHAAARSLAGEFGFEPARELYRLLRPLGGVEADLPVALPEGMGLRPFEVGQDEDAWLAVNAAAFAEHPEQGRMTLADLRERQAEDWFDPQGFLIAHPLNEPRSIAGFHWTKVHPATEQEPARGEVHVVGISPEQQGKGLGKALTVAGLHHLARNGLAEALLYVDGDNTPAMELYRALGFQPWHLDVMFSRR